MWLNAAAVHIVPRYALDLLKSGRTIPPLWEKVAQDPVALLEAVHAFTHSSHDTRAIRHGNAAILYG
jgi:hypothetical protein